jgi:hypothetical protein
MEYRAQRGAEAPPPSMISTATAASAGWYFLMCTRAPAGVQSWGPLGAGEAPLLERVKLMNWGKEVLVW